ncbi:MULTISPECIES: hypothetical protein [unclassified Neisseria]|uniref:hypothetical protein n=1 Tax=unclassified Neisseria TaxID=2623750 RepID=UPI001071F5C5|nr:MULTISPECIES: hypothetical protein [unclassified Neisseria]MBF0802933.1 hypothetical protein [Neisseria sp. 19428wB4_WF04]TFU44462.1 hypothetical protein E4T99_00875 [Neisseria sp. WF04]
MKKQPVSLYLLFILALTACNQQLPSPEAATGGAKASSATVEVARPEPPTPELKLIEDTQYITDKLKTIPTLGKVVIYTEDTDPNKLLGRQGQYIGKLNFNDTRYQMHPENFGTIEIFKTKGELEDRYNYVATVTKSTPFTVYQFKHENLLMRLPHDMTPTQVKEYQAALEQMK